MANHHPPHDILTAYTAGGLDEAEDVLVATHLTLCPACRAECADLEALGGALLAGIPPEPPPPGSLEALLERLDQPPPPQPSPPPAEGPLDIPLPLRRFTGPLSRIEFRTVVPGIRRFDLPMSRLDRPVALVSMRPGLTIPPHHHAASERGLILAGGFTDEVGHFVRGDVCVRGPDEEEPHQQKIDDGEDCVVLMVDDGPKIPTTVVGKVVNFLFGM